MVFNECFTTEQMVKACVMKSEMLLKIGDLQQYDVIKNRGINKKEKVLFLPFLIRNSKRLLFVNI